MKTTDAFMVKQIKKHQEFKDKHIIIMGLRVKHKDVALLDLELRGRLDLEIKTPADFEGMSAHTCA